MTEILARFPGTCGKCQKSFPKGTVIRWEKGRAEHTDCGAAPKQPARRRMSAGRHSASRGPRYPSSAPQPGAHQISATRKSRDDQHHVVGQVIHAPKVTVDGGGPDKRYYVVLGAKMWPPNEDAGYYSWTESAWVRAATDVEAAPVAERVAARERAQAQRARLEQLIRVDSARIPEERAREVPAGEPGPSVILDGYTYSIVGDIARCAHGGFYDDYRASAWHVPATGEIRSLIIALGGRVAS